LFPLFATGVNHIGGKFTSGVIDTSGLTPAANFVDKKSRDTVHVTNYPCSGAATGCAASPQELEQVRAALPPALPVLVGSGVTAANLASFAPATALIVGTHFKQGDHWANPLDQEKIRQLIELSQQFKRVS
jgi:predicted TIM-barrel enzyme